MANNYEQLVQALRYLIQQVLEQKTIVTRGLLGDGQGNVDVPNQEGFSFVRPDRSSGKVFRMFNKVVQAPDGTPVLIGRFPWEPDLQQVIAVDWKTYLKVGWDNRFSGDSKHGDSHIWKDGGQVGGDPFTVYLRQMFPLRTEAGATGTTSVTVNPYKWFSGDQWYTWPGTPGLDLSPAIPAGTGTVRNVLIYWDPYANGTGYGQLGVATGTLVSSATATLIPEPTPPADTLPSAFVRLYGGANELSDANIWDARQAWTIPGANSGITGGVWNLVGGTGPDIYYNLGSVGIGTPAPTGTFHTVQSGSDSVIRHDAYGGESETWWRRAGGTLASPSGLASGTFIANHDYYGFQTSTNAFTLGARMSVAMLNNPATGKIPAGFVWYTHDTSLSAGQVSERMRLMPGGTLVIGGAAPILANSRVELHRSDDVYFVMRNTGDNSGERANQMRFYNESVWGAYMSAYRETSGTGTFLTFGTNAANSGNPSGRMWINPAGQVAIGTSTFSASRQLEVASDNGAQLKITRLTAGSQAAIEFNNTDRSWTIGVNSSEDFFIRDETGAATPFLIADGAGGSSLTIDASGFVTVGNTSDGVANSYFQVRGGSTHGFKTRYFSGVVGSAIVLVQDGTPDVANVALIWYDVTHSDGTNVANFTGCQNNNTAAVVISTGTWTFTCNAAGQLTLARSAGSGSLTGVVAVLYH